MSVKVGELHAALDLSNSAFLTKLKSSQAAFMASTNKMKAAAKLLGVALVAGLAVAAAGIGAAAFKAGKEYDEALKIIRVGTGATGKALDQLGGVARAVFRQVPDDMKTVAQATADLNTRTGQTGKGLERLTKTMLDLADVAGEDINTLIPATTRLFGDWSIKTKDQTGTLDKLFRASQATGIGVGTLAEQMVQFGSPLRQLGLGFDFSAAMFARFEKEGVNVQTLMPGLRMALKNFAQPTDDLAEKFDKLGINAAKPEKGLMQTFEAIKKATPKDATNLAFEVFGARAGPDMAAAIREGRFSLEEMMDVLANGTDTISAADKASETFGEKWEVFKHRVQDALVPLGMLLTNIADKVLGWLIATTDKTGGLAKAFAWVSDLAATVWPTIQSIIVVAATTVRGALSGIASAAEFVASNWGAIEPIVLSIGALVASVLIPHWIALGVAATVNAVKQVAAWALAQASAAGAALAHGAHVVGMVARWALLGAQSLLHAGRVAAAWLIAMGPIGIVIAAVTGLTVIVVKNWDSIKKALAAAWEWIAKTAESVWGAITRFFSSVWSAITDTATRAWDAFKGMLSRAWDTVVNMATTIFGLTLPGLILNNWQKIRDFTANVWNAVRDFLKGLWDRVRETASNVFTAIKEFFANLWGAVRDKVTGVWDAIRDFLKERWANLLAVATNLFTAIKDFIGNVWENIRGAAKHVWELIVALIRGNMRDAFDKVKEIGGNILGWFKDLPGTIKDIFANAGKWLLQLGKDVLEGFWNGLKSVWDNIKSWFGGIVNWIKEHKGPLSLDRKLLVPHGRAIMEGFNEGLQAGFGKVAGSVGAVANKLQDMFPGLVITSTYRPGNPNSFHADRDNPAHDVAMAGWPSDTSGVFNKQAFGVFQAAMRLYSNAREIIYGAWEYTRGQVVPYRGNDHWGHVHIADEGAIVRGPALIAQGGITEAHIPLSGPAAQAWIRSIASEMAKAGGRQMPSLEQTIIGVLPGDVQRETERALRKTALEWEMA